MYIHLKWTNVNTQSVTTNIYRSTTAIDRNNLGTPLVTFTDGTTEYYDRAVTAGTVYYYAIEYVGPTSRVVSNVYSFTADYVRGMGNNSVILGNDDYGFMGYTVFPSVNDMLAKIGIDRDTTTPTNDSSIGFTKYSIGGKVYYLGIVNNSWTAYASALAYFKRTDKQRITIDGIDYLNYPLDCAGSTYVFDGSYGSKVASGERDLMDYLVIPQLGGVPIDGSWKSDVLGRINSTGNTVGWVSKVDPSSSRIATWLPTTNMINYIPSSSWTTQYFIPILLELVEG